MKVALVVLLVGGVCLSDWAANGGEAAPASAPVQSQQDVEALKAERRAEREKRRAEFRARMEKRRAERDARMKQEIQNLEAKADAAESQAKAEAANAEPAPEVTAVADRTEKRSEKRSRHAEVSPEMERCIRDAVRAEVRPLLDELRQLRRELDGRIRQQERFSARNLKQQKAE